jgi:hypothetical protein
MLVRSNVSVGSIATEMGCPPHVCFPPNSDRTADIAEGPFRARNGLLYGQACRQRYLRRDWHPKSRFAKRGVGLFASSGDWRARKAINGTDDVGTILDESRGSCRRMRHGYWQVDVTHSAIHRVAEALDYGVLQRTCELPLQLHPRQFSPFCGLLELRLSRHWTRGWRRRCGRHRWRLLLLR